MKNIIEIGRFILSAPSMIRSLIFNEYLIYLNFLFVNLIEIYCNSFKNNFLKNRYPQKMLAPIMEMKNDEL
jgi:hypothetical protein